MTDFIEYNLSDTNMYDNIGINIDPYLNHVNNINDLNHPVPISNICFPKNTPIITNHGTISIEKINPKIHTIQNKKIVAITKTISLDTYLVCFEKHSLGFNYPNKNTIMSKQHKVMYKGQLIKADKFLDVIKNVKKIEYNGEILYNILLENYDTIEVNNLICETLHPDNIIAKLYSTKFNNKYKTNLIVMLNESIIKKKYSVYKKLTSCL